MQLKIKDVKVVGYKDVEDLIEHIYGNRPDIQNGEFHNGSYFLVDAFTADQYDEEGLKEITEYADLFSKRTRWNRGLDLLDVEAIFTDLAIKEIIPAGEYLITISW